MLLMEKILTMVCHGVRLTEIYLLLMGELLPMVLLLMVHGMRRQWVVMWQLRDRGGYTLQLWGKEANFNVYFCDSFTAQTIV